MARPHQYNERKFANFEYCKNWWNCKNLLLLSLFLSVSLCPCFLSNYFIKLGLFLGSFGSFVNSCSLSFSFLNWVVCSLLSSFLFRVWGFSARSLFTFRLKFDWKLMSFAILDYSTNTMKSKMYLSKCPCCFIHKLLELNRVRASRRSLINQSSTTLHLITD